jgi:seryl-tRNA synthetase
MDRQQEFLTGIVESGLLMETGVDGLFGRSQAFEATVEGLNALITRYGHGFNAEFVTYPPSMSRVDFERSGYLKSFPGLAGTVHSFQGDELAHRDLVVNLEQNRPWAGHQEITDLVLTPAACYPLYPLAASRGQLKQEGLCFSLCSWCFRHEPSRDPARMQAFRQREYVRIGTAEQVTEFRASCIERGEEIVRSLELPFRLDVANDPFFGRGGKMMASSQRDQKLKFELLIPITSEENPTACLSFNYHQDNFGQAWGIRDAAGEFAHTACVGFGMERITLALFAHHGFDQAEWPAAVRKLLAV